MYKVVWLYILRYFICILESERIRWCLKLCYTGSRRGCCSISLIFALSHRNSGILSPTELVWYSSVHNLIEIPPAHPFKIILNLNISFYFTIFYLTNKKILSQYCFLVETFLVQTGRHRPLNVVSPLYLNKIWSAVKWMKRENFA